MFKNHTKLILVALFAVVATALLAFVAAGREGAVPLSFDNVQLTGDACIIDEAIQFGGCFSAGDEGGNGPIEPKKILLFSETAFYSSVAARPPFIQEGIDAGRDFITEAMTEYNVTVETTDFSDNYFNATKLSEYDAVVFLSPSSDALNNAEQQAFEKYIQDGNGFVGIHYAIPGLMEPDWPWYELLVDGRFDSLGGGARFDSNRIDDFMFEARYQPTSDSHPSIAGLPSIFDHRDELYNFKYVPRKATVLLELDKSSIPINTRPDGYPKVMSSQQPISWYQADFQGGRSFYTQLGDNDRSYEPNFEKHLTAGILWAAEGNN